jgi:hypothetical protein
MFGKLTAGLVRQKLAEDIARQQLLAVQAVFAMVDGFRALGRFDYLEAVRCYARSAKLWKELSG